MRYFAKLSYQGTKYSGWQRQPKVMTVQEKIEDAIATVLRTDVPVVGCGRTDAGVHALQYVLHFDSDEVLPEDFLFRLNRILPKDIAVQKVMEVKEGAHARFDASHRAYEYHVGPSKNPFTTNTAFFYPFYHKLDRDKMQTVATLLSEQTAFFPFCKSNTDVKTMDCSIFRSEWIFKEDEMIYEVAANRFLRGMIRLIVGMSLNVGLGKLSIAEVEEALIKQERLRKSYSVPPQGLFLKDILYSYEFGREVGVPEKKGE